MDKVFLKCSKADTLLCGISFPLFSGGRKTHQYVERNLIGSSPVYRLTIVSFIEMSMCPIQNISQPDLSQVKHEDLTSRTLGTAWDIMDSKEVWEFNFALIATETAMRKV